MSYPTATLIGKDAIRGVQLPSTGDLLSSLEMYHRLSSYKQVDIVCYTFHSRMAVPSINIHSVLCCRVIGEPPPKSITLGLVSNIHSKLYICKTARSTEVYAGSWNFSPPTYHEIVLRVRGQEAKALLDYRSALWKEYTTMSW